VEKHVLARRRLGLAAADRRLKIGEAEIGAREYRYERGKIRPRVGEQIVPDQRLTQRGQA